MSQTVNIHISCGSDGVQVSGQAQVVWVAVNAEDPTELEAFKSEEAAEKYCQSGPHGRYHVRKVIRDH